MNEQLQSALALLIEKTLGGIDAASQLLMSEMPDVLYQLLLWYGVKSALMTLTAIIAIPLYIRAEIKVFNACNSKDIEGSDNGVFLIGGYGMLGCLVRIPIIAFLIFLLSSLSLEWLQIWIAPKIWLLEYAASLAN